MREIVVISGKGGVGKTSFTGAFASIVSNHIICDLDVDAPDLHILLDPKIKYGAKFYAGHEAKINKDECSMCGTCEMYCKFDAISQNDEGFLEVDKFKCEGCGVCAHICPVDAIEMNKNHCGEWYISDTRFGTFVHAKLYPGEENSGLLVSKLKEEAKKHAEQQNAEIILYDGSAGIGCPVIASLKGSNLAVIIVEPTLSGIHDMKRACELADGFSVSQKIIINKYDINDHNTIHIEKLCKEKNISIIGKIPHNLAFTQAMTSKKTVCEFDEKLKGEIENIWNKI
jgi:MinD superfamily P-loop ATPase